MLRRTIALSATLMLLFGVLMSAAGAQERAAVDPADFTASPVQVESSYDVSLAAAAATTEARVGNRVGIIVVFEEGANPTAQLRSRTGGQVTNTYDTVFDGVSMLVPDNKLDAVKRLDGVARVYVDQLKKVHTSVTPAFTGAEDAWVGLGGVSSAGEGVVIGVVDTGIWPEHPSFADPDPNGFAYPAPPATFTGVGCDFGNVGFNPDDDPFVCNDKLVAAYNFTATYAAIEGLLPTEFDSARDSNGHGTHTTSTAGGNNAVPATLLGVARGLVSGIAPRAHVAMYKACGFAGCFTSDLVAAIDQAVADGVDVINYSIGGGATNPFSDPDALAFLNAFDMGVSVATSAGNDGPGANSVGSPANAPWLTAVGANTSDRHYISTVTMTSTSAGPLVVTGATVTGGIGVSTPVVHADDFGDDLCLDPFAPGTFTGQIVICERGIIARVEKSFNVMAGGAGGMLLLNPTLQGLATDNHFIPSVHLEVTEGDLVRAYEAANTDVEATFTPGVETAVPGNVMAPFSSRGGDAYLLTRPDITAPGVQILAGHTPEPDSVEGGVPGELFQAIQGTSMSSPHVAGAMALLKDAHPGWGPAEIRSALMLSAINGGGVLKEDGVTPADPFDMGSGALAVDRAIESPLTMPIDTVDFFNFQNEIWKANLPSVYLTDFPGFMKVDRTLHDETGKTQKYDTTVVSPPDLIVSVPKTINVKKDSDETFPITIDATSVPIGETRHAWIELTRRSNGETYHIPVSIIRGYGGIIFEKDCTPTVFPRGSTTDCEIYIENTLFSDVEVKVFDPMPKELRVEKGSVVGGTMAKNRKSVSFTGVLGAADPPIVDAAVDNFASPFGFFSLPGLGVPPLGGFSDESILNLTGFGAFEFAGETYDTIGMVSNGYALPGGGTGSDVDFINSDFPDPATPNNVLAPFWTDLNPSAGGLYYAAILTAGPFSWLVLEWEESPNWGDGELNTFQIWIGLSGVEDISFTYGPVSDGDGGFLTVGAENKFGNSGTAVYFDGVGTPPAPSFGGGNPACDAAWPSPPCYEVDVFSVPGAPGDSHTISFTAKGMRPGVTRNVAEMTAKFLDGGGQVFPVPGKFTAGVDLEITK